MWLINMKAGGPRLSWPARPHPWDRGYFVLSLCTSWQKFKVKGIIQCWCLYEITSLHEEAFNCLSLSSQKKSVTISFCGAPSHAKENNSRGGHGCCWPYMIHYPPNTLKVSFTYTAGEMRGRSHHFHFSEFAIHLKSGTWYPHTSSQSRGTTRKNTLLIKRCRVQTRRNATL